MTPTIPASCQGTALLDALKQSEAPGQLAKAQLEIGQQALDAAFADCTVGQLMAARATLVDELLMAAWQCFGLHKSHGVALLAVGGYGRSELHPESDIDLLVLTDKEPDATGPLPHKLESFIAFLWDTGLKVGHSVRPLAVCVAMAKADITITTNIMESRTLCGNDSLRRQLVEHTSPAHIWPVAGFFEAKRQEQIQRHRGFNDTEYNLEPDIKSSPGGLRDLHTIRWVARRYFHTSTLEELADLDFLTQRELSYLLRSRDLLWQIRWVLHRLAGRDENRLLFDYQRDVASRLGYHGDNNNLAVERFMRDYYRAALAVSVLNELLLQLFDEAILQPQKTQQIFPINRHFQVNNHYLEAVSPTLFEEHPKAILDIFVLQAQNPSIKGIRAATIRQMFEARRLIDRNFRNDPANSRVFMTILRATDNPYDVLTRMKRYGILAQYLPEFGRIIGMMQYDLFHRYTVDAHTLLVLKTLRKFRFTENGSSLTLATRLLYRLPKPELLYVAGLYHDIAKGRGGDHSQLGADDAEAFCARHGLSRWDAELVSWLVRHHLLMSITAQRKDISDPEVVYDFARQVGDLVHLDYLYLLTIADINATNPSLWNSWRESLLRQLHTASTKMLRRGLDSPVNRNDWVSETRQEAQDLLKTRGVSPREAAPLLASLGDEYFMRESAEDIAWHAEAILHHQQQDDATRQRPMVMAHNTDMLDASSGTQLFIYTPDSENLFAATVNALDHLNLTIANARIITASSGFSLDTYVVLNENGDPIGNNPQRLAHICEQLTETLCNPQQFGDLVKRRLPRQYRHFDVPTQVIISNDLRGEYTIVNVQALDRPGLLAHIGRIFMHFNLLVHNARIATMGERAEDVFYVTDQHNQPLSDPELGRSLRTYMQEELDAVGEQQQLGNG